MKKLKYFKKWLFIALVVIFMFSGYFFVANNQWHKKTSSLKEIITINSHNLMAEIVYTDAQKIKGLSGRPILAENEGMIFIFDKPDYYNFWMKDMNFPLDFIWINNNQIVDLTENIQSSKNKSNFPPIFTAKQPFDKVIEVNAGWIKTKEVKIGDEIKEFK